MAEKKGKFSALADLHRQPIEAEASSPEPLPVQAAPSPVTEGKGRGRPATGKRSNPDWKLYSFLLKKQTHHAAVAKLHAEENQGEDKRDLSEIIQELLENWLKS